MLFYLVNRIFFCQADVPFLPNYYHATGKLYLYHGVPSRSLMMKIDTH